MVWRLLSKVMSTTAIVIVLIAAFGLLYVHLQGMQLLSVQSGSMTPAIQKGDLVVVNSVPEELAVGDVITFQQSGNESVLITHRIVEIPNSDDFVITQGDANATDDGLIPVRNIVGRVDLDIPKIGAAIDFIKQPVGLIVAIWVPAILIMASEIRRLARHYKAIAPYKHPSADNEPVRALTGKQKAQRVVNLGLAMVIMSSAISLPVWATMFDTATLTGNTISSTKKSGRADHIVIRQVAFRCSRVNTDEENFRPSIVLYNPTREKFELEGWTLESSDGVLAEFDEDDELKRRRNLRIRPHLTDGLNYSGDQLALRDQNGEVVDAISWGDDTTFLNPALPAADEGVRFQRKPKYVDTDMAEDFRVRTYHGCSHSCFRYDPWERDYENVVNVSINVYVRQVSETAARE